MTVLVLWPFLAVPWVCLQCLIVAFLDHTHISQTLHTYIIEVDVDLVQICRLGHVCYLSGLRNWVIVGYVTSCLGVI